MKSKGEDAQAVINEMRSVADRIKVLDEELKSEKAGSARSCWPSPIFLMSRSPQAKVPRTIR